MKVLIIIPAYNEELNIKNTVSKIISISKKSEDQIDYVVIDDGSKDNTLEVCKQNKFNVISLIENLGIGEWKIFYQHLTCLIAWLKIK